MASSAPEGSRQTKRAVWIVGLVVLGAIAWLLVSQSGKASSYAATVQGASLSPGGRWVLAVNVQNLGSSAGAPDCTFTALDPDGVTLATDSAQLGEIAAGSDRTENVLTGLSPGDHTVAAWTAECH